MNAILAGLYILFINMVCRFLAIGKGKENIMGVWDDGIFKIGMALICIGLFTMCVASCDASVTTTIAVIHHTDSSDVSSKEIGHWHKARGWDCIGYHFVIRANGVIETGRDINKKGAHALGRNNYVGIALTGRDFFTTAQKQGLKKLLRRLGTREIQNHHQRCPGKGLDLGQIAEEIHINFKEVR